MMHVRAATSNDREGIRAVHLSAFGEDERERVAELGIELLDEDTTPEIISLVTESERSLIGHIALSPVQFQQSSILQGYLLGPLGVIPRYQRSGIGTDLIKKSTELLTSRGVHILFVYGDPNYYNRFGFNTGDAELFTPPYPLQYPFGWLAKVLNRCDEATISSPISCVSALCDPELW